MRTVAWYSVIVLSLTMMCCVHHWLSLAGESSITFFTWYGLADLCAREGIAFVLGHALYRKAIHGGKAKNDRIDAERLALAFEREHMAFAHVLSEDARRLRELQELHRSLVQTRKRLAIHARGILRGRGIDLARQAHGDHPRLRIVFASGGTPPEVSFPSAAMAATRLESIPPERPSTTFLKPFLLT